MKKSNRIISLVLCFAMLISAFSMLASAADIEATVENQSFENTIRSIQDTGRAKINISHNDLNEVDTILNITKTIAAINHVRHTASIVINKCFLELLWLTYSGCAELSI